jgi:hypothetical protein
LVVVELELEREEHGGGCCGITHLYNFPFGDTHSLEQKKAGLQKEIDYAVMRHRYADDWIERREDGEDDIDIAKDWRHAIEVILNEHQLQHWNDVLEAVGFKQVFSFLNNNSGNECFVYYLETNRPS